MTEAGFAVHAWCDRARQDWEGLLRLYYGVWHADARLGNAWAHKDELWSAAYWDWLRDGREVRHERIEQETKWQHDEQRRP